MKDQLPSRLKIPETGIINLDDNTGPVTHSIGYAIHLKSIIYLDSYGLSPLLKFVKHLYKINTPTWYSTLPTQTLTDHPICGRDVPNALKASSQLPHNVVHEYTMMNHLKGDVI